MEEKKYLVEVVCRQRALYEVEAADGHSAEKAAVERWQQGDASDVTGFDWCELQTARAMEAPDEVRRQQDDELLLRFIRERERLLTRLGGKFLNPTMNDAISAQQAAADLGWFRASASAESSVDSIRAAQALDRLCAARKLVCFERDRVRNGERGTIRLYCTPEYLERLSTALHGSNFA